MIEKNGWEHVEDWHLLFQKLLNENPINEPISLKIGSKETSINIENLEWLRQAVKKAFGLNIQRWFELEKIVKCASVAEKNEETFCELEGTEFEKYWDSRHPNFKDILQKTGGEIDVSKVNSRIGACFNMPPVADLDISTKKKEIKKIKNPKYKYFLLTSPRPYYDILLNQLNLALNADNTKSDLYSYDTKNNPFWLDEFLQKVTAKKLYRAFSLSFAERDLKDPYLDDDFPLGIGRKIQPMSWRKARQLSKPVVKWDGLLSREDALKTIFPDRQNIASIEVKRQREIKEAGLDRHSIVGMPEFLTQDITEAERVTIKEKAQKFALKEQAHRQKKERDSPTPNDPFFISKNKQGLARNKYKALMKSNFQEVFAKLHEYHGTVLEFPPDDLLDWKEELQKRCINDYGVSKEIAMKFADRATKGLPLCRSNEEALKVIYPNSSAMKRKKLAKQDNIKLFSLSKIEEEQRKGETFERLREAAASSKSNGTTEGEEESELIAFVHNIDRKGATFIGLLFNKHKQS